MRNLLLTIGAIAAWVLYWHIGLAAVLLYVWAAAMSTAGTAKARSTATQHAALVSAVATTNQNLSATTTTANNAQTAVTALQGGNTGFANTLGYGPTSTANIGITSGPSDTGFFNTGGASAGTAHTHGLPNFPQADHTHDFGGHTHDFGGHAHPVT